MSPFPQGDSTTNSSTERAQKPQFEKCLGYTERRFAYYLPEHVLEEQGSLETLQQQRSWQGPLPSSPLQPRYTDTCGNQQSRNILQLANSALCLPRFLWIHPLQPSGLSIVLASTSHSALLFPCGPPPSNIPLTGVHPRWCHKPNTV